GRGRAPAVRDSRAGVQTPPRQHRCGYTKRETHAHRAPPLPNDPLSSRAGTGGWTFGATDAPADSSPTSREAAVAAPVFLSRWFGLIRLNVPFPLSPPPASVPTSEVLAFFRPVAAFLACPVSRIPLEGAQGPLNLCKKTSGFLVDRVALREQHLTVFLQVSQLLPKLVHLGMWDPRLNVVRDDFLEPLPFGYA